MNSKTFKKAERITNKKTFDTLFNSGKSISVPPFRLVWIETASYPSLFLNENVLTVQIGISVPKKSFSKAVQRNKIKRRIREAYRKNKRLLYEILKKKNLTIALMIIYSAKEELSYSEIEKKMVVSLHKLVEQNNSSKEERLT